MALGFGSIGILGAALLLFISGKQAWKGHKDMTIETQTNSRVELREKTKIGLFIPCYIDMIYPEVGIATLQLLERLGLDVDYPLNQTCCGQPMSNSGDERNAEAAERLFVENFKKFDCIIGPAGSCVKQVRCHFDTLEQTDEVKHVRQHTYELVEFLHDVLQVDAFPWAEFQHSVAIHNSCSSVRGLGIAKPSEIVGVPFDKTANLLSKVKGLVLVPVDRPDDCCGFGGTFCVTDEAVSARMGLEKAHDQLRHGTEYVVSPDMSCLMHQQGVARRAGIDLKYLHVAQVLNGGPF
jgi:L-lactate dehydrogenase complex protein LldE